MQLLLELSKTVKTHILLNIFLKEKHQAMLDNSKKRVNGGFLKKKIRLFQYEINNFRSWSTQTDHKIKNNQVIFVQTIVH